MTTFVVEYDGEEVTSWRYEVDDDYQPESGELVPDNVGRREIDRMKVDTSVDPPELVDNPDYRKPESVQREKISNPSKQAFRDARSNGDTQTQLDILFEILTGEQP